MHYPKSFSKLIKHFSALPSVGPKMAERLVLHLFRQEKNLLLDFAQNLEALTHLDACVRCGNICEGELCSYCTDPQRDTHLLAVVEDPLDIIALERTGVFHGLYHVLGGLLGPVKTGGEDRLTLAPLLARIESEQITEIILAFNPTAEGDMTALYLKQKLTSSGARVTRLARGLSTGGDIEYADEESLASAIANRK